MYISDKIYLKIRRKKMGTKLNPYINFKDNTRAAMEFYQSVFGGKLTLSTFKEFQASSDSSDDDKIMHSELETENGIVFMAADTPSYLEYRPGTNISISLSGENQVELTAYFEKLSNGGTVTQPLTQAPWGDIFGMLIDKFEITWLVNIAGKKE
jgi:PhnB protein